MKWVSWATWAWEIFGRIVRYLEKDWNYIQPILNSTLVSKKPYLQITSPLNGSVYKIDNYISQSNQKISLKFSTNYEYDSHNWLIDSKKTSSDFFDITKCTANEIKKYSCGWKHNLELILMKDWQIVEKREVGFDVEVEK